MPYHSTILKLEPNAILSIDNILNIIPDTDHEKLHFILFSNFSKLMRKVNAYTGSQTVTIKLSPLSNISNADITYRYSTITGGIIQLRILQLHFY
jgi:hypothetical protein